MKRYLPLLALLLLAGCRHEGLPAGVMSEEGMVDLLTEAYQLEGFYAVETHYRYDALPETVLQRYDSLLAAQGLTRERVEQSLDYYSQHLDAYQRIHDTVVTRLEAVYETVPPAPLNNVNIAQPTLPGDSVRRSIPQLVLGK